MYWLKIFFFLCSRKSPEVFHIIFFTLDCYMVQFFSKRHLLKSVNGNVKPSLKVNTQLLREKKYAKYHTSFVAHYLTLLKFWSDAFITKPISWQRKTTSSRIIKRTMKILKSKNRMFLEKSVVSCAIHQPRKIIYKTN